MNPFNRKSKKKKKEQQMLRIIGSLEDIQERVERSEMLLAEKTEERYNLPPIWNSEREKSYSADEIMNNRACYSASYFPRSTPRLTRVDSGFSSIESLKCEIVEMKTMYEQRLQQNEDLIRQLLENRNRPNIGRDELLYEESDDLISDSAYATALGYSMVDFIDNLHPGPILDKLVSKEIVGRREDESIRGEKTRESKTRLLITILRKKSPEKIEEFLEVLNSDPAYAHLYKQVKQRLVTGPRSRVCEFCYISHHVDIRPIADQMCVTLRPDDYRSLTNEKMAITTRWQKMNELTRTSAKISKDFVQALEYIYPDIAAKVKLNPMRCSLDCRCPNEHRRISRNSVSTDDIPLMLSDPSLINEDDEELSTISRYFKDEEASTSRGTPRNNAIADMPTGVLSKTYEICNGSPKTKLIEEDTTLQKDKWSRSFKMVLGFMMLLFIYSMILSTTVSVGKVSKVMVDTVYKISLQVVEFSMEHLIWIYG